MTEKNCIINKKQIKTMPNWCETKYVIKGSKEDVSNLNSIFQKLITNETNKSGDFNKNWLGFVVNELNGDFKKINCRGWFENVRFNGHTLKLTTYSAWSPCYALFNLIVQKYPTLQYYFIAKESGCGLYATNDIEKKYFKFGKKCKVWDKEILDELIRFDMLLKEKKVDIVINDKVKEEID